MLKYLDKIKVMAETATNGQECTELVFSKEPGYYSLIIVSRKIHWLAYHMIPQLTRYLPVWYPNAGQKWLRNVSWDSQMGNEESLSPDSYYGSLRQCDDRSNWECCTCWFQWLCDETYQTQRTWKKWWWDFSLLIALCFFVIVWNLITTVICLMHRTLSEQLSSGVHDMSRPAQTCWFSAVLRF